MNGYSILHRWLFAGSQVFSQTQQPHWIWLMIAYYSFPNEWYSSAILVIRFKALYYDTDVGSIPIPQTPTLLVGGRVRRTPN